MRRPIAYSRDREKRKQVNMRITQRKEQEIRMKRQMLWKKGRQVFAAILSASMLVTSVVPEAMVSAAAEEITADAGTEEEDTVVNQSLEEDFSSTNEDTDGQEEIEGEEEEVTEPATEFEEIVEDEQTFDIPEEEDEEVSIRMELVDELNARIAALPSVEEFEKMTEDEQNSVLEEVNAIADQYYDELNGTEQELVQAEKMSALLEYMSGQVAVTAASTEDETNYIKYELNGTTLEVYVKYGGWLKTTTNSRVDPNGYNIRKIGLNDTNSTIEVIPTFKYGGRFLEVTYRVTAKSDIKNAQLGVGADIWLSGEVTRNLEKAKVIKQGETEIGFQLQDSESNSSSSWLQIYFAGDKLSSSADNHWVGPMSVYSDSSQYYRNFLNSELSKFENSYYEYTDTDLATVLAWNVNDLKKGDSAEYKMLIGFGPMAESQQILDGCKVDYKTETISGLYSGTYEVIVDNNTYTFQFDADGKTISLQGTDANGTSYDFTGKTIEVKDPDGSVKKLSVASRPAAPEKVDVSHVTFSAENNTITIPASSGREYVLVPEGTELTSEMWTKAQKITGWNSSITFAKDTQDETLNSATTYVVYSRVSATDTSMASMPSEASASLKIHSHVWVYHQEQNDEIEAYCTVGGCYQGEDNPLKLTINVESWSESGESDGNIYYNPKYPSYEIRVNNSITSITGVLCGDVTYYSVQEKGATSGGTKMEGEDVYPVEVGNYYAEVVLTVGEQSCKAVKAFSIERIIPANEQRKITNLEELSRIYDGKKIAAKYQSEIEEDNSPSAIAPTVEYKKANALDKTYTQTVPTDVGKYVVRVNYPQTDHYQASSVTGYFVIEAKPVDAVISVPNKEYDGTNTATITEAKADGINGQSLIITGLTGTFATKDVGNGIRVVINSENAKVSGAETGTNPENYTINYGEVSANINQKDLEVTVTAANKEYNGTTTAEVTAKADTGVTGESLTINGLTGTFADANAGENKSVAIDVTGAKIEAAEGTSKDNYNIIYPDTAKATISPKTVELVWSDANLIYTGRVQSVTAKVTNKANDGDKFELTYETNTKTKVGTYTAKVTGLGNSNYTLNDTKNATVTWTISYPTVEEKNEPKTSGTTKNESGWYTGDVTLTPGTGYLISKSEDPDGTWSASLTFDADGEEQITYYLKDEQGHITEAKTLTIKKDATAPTGEIKAQDTDLTASGDAGSKYFFKDNADITISATDATSGVAKIEYQIVSKASGDEYQEDGAWTVGKLDGTSLTIEANDNCVIYVRITDNAGNVTVLHTNDIIVYTEVTGSKEASYTRTTGEDMVTDIALEGNTVKEIKYGDKVLKEDEDYGVEDGKLVISSKYLEKLPAGEHELTVSWNPFGENQEEAAGTTMADSTIKISVKRADSASTETRITNAGKFSKTYDGQPAEKVTSESKNSSTPVVEYKKKDAADTTYTTEIPRDAGSYVVRVTYPQNGDYEVSVVTEEFTIAPKEIGISWNGTSFVYNGKQQTPTATATGLLGTDQCEITVNGAQTATGKYTATAVSVSNANYCLPKTGTTADFEIKEVSDKAATGLALNAGLKVSQTGSSIGIKWGKVKGADGYNVYVQYCGSKFTAKSLNQVKNGSKSSLTVKKVNGKKLNLKKNYKIYVEAYKNVNGQKIVMGRSVVAHIVGRQNSKYTNVKGIKLQKNAFTLKTGKTAAVKATTVKVNRYRRQLSDAHAKELRYATSNPAVATVTAKGKIRAVGKGSCTIYVYARNGYTKKVKVTVK